MSVVAGHGQIQKGFFERQVLSCGCRGTQGKGANETASV